MNAIGGVVRRLRAAWDRAVGAGHGTRIVEVSGAVLVVPPGVFDPVRFRSGALLAAAVASEVRPGWRVLDLGCGAGGVAVVAARAGATAVGSDVSPGAVAAARANAWLNRVAPDVTPGDLFAPVRGRFDLIAFNPPFFAPGQPTPPGLDPRAWAGHDVFGRFLAGLDHVLAEGGRGLVVGSTDGPAATWPARIDLAGWRREVAATRRWLDETETVWRLTRRT